MKILACWELGGMFGHLAKIAAIAEHLSEHTIILATPKNIQQDLTQLGIQGIKHYSVSETSNPDRLFVSMANILYCYGFSDTATLQRNLVNFVKVLEEEKPDILLIDSAPIALLAARIYNIPSVNVSIGFFIPPAVENVPTFNAMRFRRNNTAAEIKQLAVYENCVLSAINNLLTHYQQPLIETVNHFLNSATVTIVGSLKETDAYHSYRDPAQTTYINFIPQLKFQSVDISEKALIAPDNAIHCYVKTSSVYFTDVLKFFRTTKKQVFAYIPDICSDDPYPRKNIQISKIPYNMQSVAKHCRLSITTSAATATSLFSVGKPAIIIPDVVEQILNGRAIENHNLGRIPLDGELTDRWIDKVYQQSIKSCLAFSKKPQKTWQDFDRCLASLIFFKDIDHGTSDLL